MHRVRPVSRDCPFLSLCELPLVTYGVHDSAVSDVAAAAKGLHCDEFARTDYQ